MGSDTLARKLIANGEKGHKFNFPDDDTEVYPEKDAKFSSNFIGACYNGKSVKWQAERRSKKESKNVYNGCYKDEETAAHASDTLARKFMANGEKGHKLNFPDDHTKVYPEQKTNHFGVSYHKLRGTWQVERRNGKTNLIRFQKSKIHEENLRCKNNF